MLLRFARNVWQHTLFALLIAVHAVSLFVLYALAVGGELLNYWFVLRFLALLVVMLFYAAAAYSLGVVVGRASAPRTPPEEE